MDAFRSIALGDQPHGKAALEQFCLANVLAAGDNSAFEKDEEDIHAAHAAEDMPGVGDALLQRVLAATQTAKSALPEGH